MANYKEAFRVPLNVGAIVLSTGRDQIPHLSFAMFLGIGTVYLNGIAATRLGVIVDAFDTATGSYLQHQLIVYGSTVVGGILLMTASSMVMDIASTKTASSLRMNVIESLLCTIGDRVESNDTSKAEILYCVTSSINVAIALFLISPVIIISALLGIVVTTTALPQVNGALLICGLSITVTLIFASVLLSPNSCVKGPE